MADVEVTFGAKLDDLNAGVDQAKEALTNLAEAFGIGLSVAGLAEFVSTMAELGEQTQRTAEILGTTTTQAQLLGTEAKLVGGSTEGLTMAMARLQISLAQGGNEGSRAAEALRVLGLNAKELQKLSPEEQLNKMADAVSHFADSTTKTAALTALNRGFVQMLPLLDEGAKGMEEMRARSEEVGAVVTGQTVKSLDELQRTLVLARAAATGLGEAIVSALAPSIIAAANALSEFIANLHAVVEAGTFWERELEGLTTLVVQLAQQVVRLGAVLGDVSNLDFGKALEDWKKGAANIEAEVTRHEKALEDIIGRSKEKLQKDLSAPVKDNRPTVGTMQIGKGAGGGEALAAANEQIKAIEIQSKTAIDAAQAQFKMGAISQSELTKVELSEIDKRMNAELAALTKEEASGQLSAKQREAVEARKTQIVAQANLDRQKAVEKAAEAEKKAFDKVGDEILSAWNSQLRSVLAGTESFSDGMKKMFGDLVIKLIEMIEQVIVKMMVLLAFEAATGTLGANAVGSAFTASVGKVLGAATGLWNVGNSTAAFPRYDAGSMKIPGTQMALLHAGEMVVPAGPAQAIRDSFASGGGGAAAFSPTINLSAFNPAGMQQLIRAMMPQLAREYASFASKNFSQM